MNNFSYRFFDDFRGNFLFQNRRFEVERGGNEWDIELKKTAKDLFDLRVDIEKNDPEKKMRALISGLSPIYEELKKHILNLSPEEKFVPLEELISGFVYQGSAANNTHPAALNSFLLDVSQFFLKEEDFKDNALIQDYVSRIEKVVVDVMQYEDLPFRRFSELENVEDFKEIQIIVHPFYALLIDDIFANNLFTDGEIKSAGFKPEDWPLGGDNDSAAHKFLFTRERWEASGRSMENFLNDGLVTAANVLLEMLKNGEVPYELLQLEEFIEELSILTEPSSEESLKLIVLPAIDMVHPCSREAYLQLLSMAGENVVYAHSIISHIGSLRSEDLQKFQNSDNKKLRLVFSGGYEGACLKAAKNDILKSVSGLNLEVSDRDATVYEAIDGGAAENIGQSEFDELNELLEKRNLVFPDAPFENWRQVMTWFAENKKNIAKMTDKIKNSVPDLTKLKSKRK